MINWSMHPILGFLLTGTVLYVLSLFYALYRYWFKRKHLRYKGKHVFISGGSTGLGLCIAQDLYQKGASVTIVARNEDKLKKAVEIITKTGSGRVQYLMFDFNNPEVKDVEKLIDQSESKFGDIEYLFCTAGFALPNMFLEADQTYFERQINTNYLGYVKTSQPVAKRMAKRKSGTIIYTSSAWATTVVAGYSTYSPSKSAIKALADIARVELAVHNITVHLYLPGSILTPGFEEENRIKPEVTKRIEGTADYLTPKKCSKILLEGMERGDYIITSEMLFEYLNITSIGSCDRDNFLFNLVASPLSIIANYLINYINHNEMRKTKQKLN